MVGTTDFNKHYHPIGIMISKTETQEDFAFMFKSIKQLVQAIFNIEYKPTILLADCADEITSGLKKKFELEKRVYCWFHVKKAIEKNIKRYIKNNSTITIILKDIGLSPSCSYK